MALDTTQPAPSNSGDLGTDIVGLLGALTGIAIGFGKLNSAVASTAPAPTPPTTDNTTLYVLLAVAAILWLSTQR